MAIKITDSAAGTKRFRGTPQQANPSQGFGNVTLDNRGRRFNQAPDTSRQIMQETDANYSAQKAAINTASDLAKQGVEYYVAIKESEDKERTNQSVLLANEQERQIEREVKDEQIAQGKSVGWYEDQMKERSSNMWQELESKADLRSKWGRQYFKDQKHKEVGVSQSRRIESANKQRTANAIKDTERRLDITMHEARETENLVELKVLEEKIDNTYVERAMYDVTMTKEQVMANARDQKVRMYDNFFDEAGEDSYEDAMQALESFEDNVAPIGYEMQEGDSPDMVADVYTREEYEERIDRMQRKAQALKTDEAAAEKKRQTGVKTSRDATFENLKFRLSFGRDFEGVPMPSEKEIVDAMEKAEGDPSGISVPQATTLMTMTKKKRTDEARWDEKLQQGSQGEYQFNQLDTDDIAAVEYEFDQQVTPALQKEAQENFPGQIGQQQKMILQGQTEYFSRRGILPPKEIEDIQRGLTKQAGEAQNQITMEYVNSLVEKNPKFIEILPDDLRRRVNYVDAGGLLEHADEVHDDIEGIEPKRRKTLDNQVTKHLAKDGMADQEVVIQKYFNGSKFRNQQSRDRFGHNSDLIFTDEYLRSDGNGKFAYNQRDDLVRTQYAETWAYSGGRTVEQHPIEKIWGHTEPQRWVQYDVQRQVKEWRDVDGIDINEASYQLVATYDDTLNVPKEEARWIVADENGIAYTNGETGEPLYYQPNMDDPIVQEMKRIQNNPNVIAKFANYLFSDDDDMTLKEQNVEKARRMEIDTTVAP